MSVKEKILTSAQHFFFTLGYHQTSVQMIIDDLGIAKGTFYHHYKSKLEVMQAVSEEMVSSGVEAVKSYIFESEDDAIKKFNYLLKKLNQWKVEQIDAVYTIIKVMYSDDNLPFREAINHKNVEYYLPILNHIIRQGIEEGSMQTEYADIIGEMMIRFSIEVEKTMAFIMLNHEHYQDPVKEVLTRVNCVTQIFEDALKVPSGSFSHQLDVEIKTIFEHISHKNRSVNHVID